MLTRGIHGTIAAVKWSYFTAAAVHGYTVTQHAAGAWSVAGTFVPGLVDAYKIAQRPIYFVAPFKGGAWRWPIESLAVLEGGRFTARLGPLTTEGSNGLSSPTPRT